MYSMKERVFTLLGCVVLASAVGYGVVYHLSLTYGAALTVAVVTIGAFLRSDRVVGILGSSVIVMVVLLPIHLVPNLFRLAEMLVLVLVSAVILARRPLPRTVHMSMMGLVAGYFVVTFLSTRSMGITGAMYQFILHVIIGVTFLIVGLYSNPDERQQIVRVIIGLAVVESIYAAYEVLFTPAVLWASPVPESFKWPSDRLGSEIIPGLLRAQGTFGHPLLMSMFLAVGLALTARHHFNNPMHRYWITAVILAGGFATGSRSTIIIMIAVLFFAYGPRTLSWVRGLVLTGLTLGFALLFSFSTSGVYQRFSESDSVSHREGALDAAERLLDQSFTRAMTGSGWYSREWLFDRNFLQLDGFLAIDNQFVSLIATSGLIGLGIFVAIIIGSVWFAQPEYRPAVLSLFAMYFVFDVNEFPAPWAILMLLIGLSCHRPEPEPEEDDADDQVSAVYRQLAPERT
ncbi:O-antigen ligase family protein [Williamsia soli]|uniref:O-antigen ligase family protein n=1 Tax=Williamsia soli TaxID=364929 RepID=UPI001A9FC525|nr:hypothetical protein [Williamsia soli]